MASGVNVDDECKTAFQEMKLGHKHRYIVFKLTDDLKRIVVETRAEPSQTYDDFKAAMKQAEAAKECRYAIFDVVYSTVDGQPRNKICFFMWSPETAMIKQRMVYASSKDALKKALGEGIAKEIQANDHSDLEFSNVMDQIRKTERT
jgi:cofilin